MQLKIVTPLSVGADKVLELVKEGIGIAETNNRVNNCVRDWAVGLLMKVVDDEEEGGEEEEDGEVRRDELLRIALKFSDIGNALSNLSFYNEALKAYGRCLAIYENVLGKEHEYTATMYNNIALVMWNKGDLDRALGMYKQALEI